MYQGTGALSALDDDLIRKSGICPLAARKTGSLPLSLLCQIPRSLRTAFQASLTFSNFWA